MGLNHEMDFRVGRISVRLGVYTSVSIECPLCYHGNGEQTPPLRATHQEMRHRRRERERETDRAWREWQITKWWRQRAKESKRDNREAETENKERKREILLWVAANYIPSSINIDGQCVGECAVCWCTVGKPSGAHRAKHGLFRCKQVCLCTLGQYLSLSSLSPPTTSLPQAAVGRLLS